jgi:hypothetical protein
MDGLDAQASSGTVEDDRRLRVMAYNDALTLLKAQPLSAGMDPADVFARLYRTLLDAHRHVQYGEVHEEPAAFAAH